MKSTKTLNSQFFKEHLSKIIFIVTLAIVGIFYVSMTLTPSHYAVIYTDFLGLDYEPLYGEARAIREDEYAVVTPYFQIAVNNDFQRYNQNSPYGEDLRHYVGLPLQDWALVFKPYMWGFWTMGPAKGLSFYHYFMIAAFFTGFVLFLTQLNLSFLYSVIITGILFFSHMYQVFWSNNAPLLALTIWIILPFLYNWSFKIKFLTTFYLSMMALLALVYPAWQISLMYVFAFLALAFRKDSFSWKNIIICGCAFVTACGLYYFYLQDIVPLVQNTIYPGQKVHAGGSLSKYFLWSTLAPHALIHNFFKPIIIENRINVTEVSTVSSLLLPFLICFANFKWAYSHLQKNLWIYGISSIFLILSLAWLLVPIPSDVAKFIFFDKISSHRYLIAFGSFVVCLNAFITFYTKWTISWLRIASYLFIVFCIPIVIYTKQHGAISITNALDRFDILAILIVVVLMVLKVFNLSGRTKLVSYVFVLTALLYNIVSFGHYNPLQKASDIFSKDLEAKITTLKTDLQLSNEKLIAFEASRPISSGLLGLGLPTLHHTQFVPQIEFYKEKFPDLDSEEIAIVFNRFAKIGTVDTFVVPKLVYKDLIGIPGKTAAIHIEVELTPSDHLISITPPKQAYVHDIQWSEIIDTQRTLKLEFYHPYVLDTDSSKATIVFSESPNNPFYKDSLTITASVIAKPNLKHFLSSENPDVASNTTWQLFLDFKSEQLDILKSLDSTIQNLYIQDFQSDATLYPVNNLQVENIETTSLPPKGLTHTQYGYIDYINYNSELKELSITGWAPSEDFPSARWIAYTSNGTIEFKSVRSMLRTDVPLTQGKDPLKGFEIIFFIPNYQENTPIPLCLYSSTQALGIFSIHTGQTDLNCSKNVIEKLEQPIRSANPQGNIDVVEYDPVSKILTIQGWAPPSSNSTSFGSRRWFGYDSDLEAQTDDLKSMTRLDVARVFGESYTQSGFKLSIKFPESLETDLPIDLCLYGRTTELGEFYIPSAQNNPVISCVN